MIAEARSTKSTLEAPSFALALEAVLTLACARLMVGLCFRLLAPLMLRRPRADAIVPPQELALAIRQVIESCSSSVPWTSLCLANAVAAKLMLARRGFSSTIHFGVETPNGALRAHAWLAAGDLIVTGEDGMHGTIAIPL